MTIETISIDTLIRSVAVNKKIPHLLFLGAGASISSGVPSAADCIWYWKQSIFLTKNPGLEKQFGELSLESTKKRIQEWLDAQRIYPPFGSTDEYGHYIETCYPRDADRRSFFEERVKQAAPYVGYQLLAQLAKSGLIANVWTTNFDTLVARAASSANVTVREVGIDCQHRLPNSPVRGELLCVSLHGDYRYDKLKNTGPELQAQEQELIRGLIDSSGRMPAIVCGYSGRDRSIMEAFQQAYRGKGNSPIYWCEYADVPPSDTIHAVLDTANANGKRGYYLPGVGFDDLMRRLALHCLEGDQAESVRVLANHHEKEPVEQIEPFALPSLPITGLIKSNAFEVTPPTEMLQFDLHTWPQERVWSAIRALGDQHGFVAAPLKGKVYAFSTPAMLRNAFGENLKGPIERIPISTEDVKYENTATLSLMRCALVRGLAQHANVLTDGDDLIWFSQSDKTQTINNAAYRVHSAVLVFLRPLASSLLLILKPTLHITSASGEKAPLEVERLIKQKILGYQHNYEFNAELLRWRDLLLPQGTRELIFPNEPGGFAFRVNRAPLLATVTDERDKMIHLDAKTERLITQRGLQLSEPQLVFADAKGGHLAHDPHPVRGLLSNRPYDVELNARGLAGPIRLGIVCPHSDAKRFRDYLHTFNLSVRSTKPEQDYLPDFPGFGQSFHTSLTIPDVNDPLWVDCPEPDLSGDAQKESLTLGQQIGGCVANLKASYAPNVVLIYIPRRWEFLRKFDNENESFDLHDYVKASAVTRGVATQFIEERTLLDTLQCRVHWWLSLAMYAKSMRTPWVLDCLDSNTAYVGLGFAMARFDKTRGPIVLGCSHIYNAQGQGLQFRLSKIESPSFDHKKNPFMSFDDARRLGETIRQQFFEAHMALPKRVVIHKQTPFRYEEKQGLQAGLDGVENIELVQLFVDDALRYIASKYQDGKFKADGYPIQRGTTVIVDSSTALLWVHGASTALNPRLKYYQGKRRIPAPLVVRRFAGRSDLTSIVTEVLGLSKMNWNSFDLYAQLPATIDTSQKVARIGSLLERFHGASFDYRLFM